MSADERLAAVLYDHRDDALTCYDHSPGPNHPVWCCVCGAHELTGSWRAHVAAALRDAGYVHRDEAVGAPHPERATDTHPAGLDDWPGKQARDCGGW